MSPPRRSSPVRPRVLLAALSSALGCTAADGGDPAAESTVATFPGGSDDTADDASTAAGSEGGAPTGTSASPTAGTSSDDAAEESGSEDDGGATTGGARDCNAGPSIVGVSNDGEYNYASAFPIRYTFDDDLYATSESVVWASADAGASHEFVPDGGWDGCGAARFRPPAVYENMSGIGQILDLRDVMESSTLAIRYCISVGATFPELASGAKPIILWRGQPGADDQGHDDAVGARPMVISRPDPAGRGIAYGLCDGTVCTYVGGDFWPDGSDTWVLADDGWSCLEFDFDLANDSMELYVTTQDGRFDDTPYLSATFRDEASGPGGVFTAIDIVGGYFAQSVSDPDNYYVIDDLVIDTAHIGPPPGFAG